MSKFELLISQRTKKKNEPSKMSALARQSAEGQLTSFSGIFGTAELHDGEKKILEEILNRYATQDADVSLDLPQLISITTEVKAINNQAAILHGERIKKAQKILKRYEEGAFSAWLVATYGNRQTPYNFLQYFEFYEQVPKTLRSQLEAMPRQAVYTLASGEGPFDKKQNIVAKYNGQSKQELLELIREMFPLAIEDKRRQNLGEGIFQQLKKAQTLMNKPKLTISKQQKEDMTQLLKELLPQRDALQLLHKKISKLIQVLAAFAQKYASLPCVGFTHFQTAQPTTVRKRACL